MDLFAESCGATSGLGRAVQRVHFHEFMHWVHRELHRLRCAGADRTTRAVARGVARGAQLLAFDEFQITNISDALIVETLFDALFAEGVVVVMTSNRPPEDLYKDGLNRHLAIPQFLALLRRRGVAFHELAAACDFRAAAAWAQPSSVPPLAAQHGHGPWRDFFCEGEGGGDGEGAFLASAFAAAAGVPGGEPASVPIAWGRSLEVTEVAGGVGRFTFGQLCGEALNADDYLSLARRFHTLVVGGVPRFSLEQHNEARRFTNLVDCAYERHARLVLSAAAPPDRLLESMEALAGLSLAAAEEEEPSVPSSSRRAAAAAAAAALTPAGSSDWIRNNPFSPQPASVTEAIRLAAAGPNDAAPGNDATNTGSGVAGVMAGAVGSLQESGFAARRAASRLLHMQTEEYLAAHRRHRLGHK